MGPDTTTNCIKTIQEVILARNNYSYQKHIKELAKKKKKEEKRQRKLDQKNAQPQEDSEQIPSGDIIAEPPVDEQDPT